MSPLPAVDPIPLPAPVWLFKILEVFTVSLHFLAMQLLVGGLLIGSVWAIVGRRRHDQQMLDASGAIATRLPIIMTYVINLGVPPLLFAQVLYGRALYTSSILIGVFWISVILLLMISYTCLYIMSNHAEKGRAWGWIGLVASVVVLKIGIIYSSNMTLMLRPDVWREMYRGDALGLHLNMGDPTVVPRWLFMMFGGLTVGGVGLMLLGMTTYLRPETGEFLRRWGARTCAAGAAIQCVVAVWVFRSQLDAVREALGQSTLYLVCLIVWVLLTLLLIGLAVTAQGKAVSANWIWPASAALLGFLQVVTMTLYRGGIRDAALAMHGFNVWDREVVANWIVVAAFLLLFVASLAVMAWLIRVVVQSRRVEETYA